MSSGDNYSEILKADPSKILGAGKCFTAKELELINKESRLSTDQMSIPFIKYVAQRVLQTKDPVNKCLVLSPTDSIAIGKLFCLNRTEIEEIKRDGKMLEQLTDRRINEIIAKIKESLTNADCAISTQTVQQFKDLLVFLQTEQNVRLTGQLGCISPQNLNSILSLVQTSEMLAAVPEESLYYLTKVLKKTKERCTSSPNIANILQVADILNAEYQKRRGVSPPSTDTLEQKKVQKYILDLPIREFMQNMSDSLSKVFADIIAKPQDFLTIIFKDDGDRILYIGILLVAICIFWAMVFI